MLRPLLPLALLLPTAAAAADRRVDVASFDRVRAAGPLDVRIAEGPPSAVVSDDNAGRVEVRQDGATLSVRFSGLGRGGRPPARAPVVRLAGRGVSAVSAAAGAGVRVDRMRGARIDLSVTGPGGVRVADARGDDLTATLVGDGAVEVAGKAARARLVANGAGRIDAGMLDAGDLVVRLDGPGEVRARARYTAQVSDGGLGAVSIAGRPKCQIRAPAGGPVACGGE